MISSTSSEGSKNTPQNRPDYCSQGSDQSLTHLSKLSANGDSDYEAVTKDSGQLRLQELGYRQELRREFGLLSSTAAGFAVMSYLLGITGGLPISYVNGGPVSAIWGWVIVTMGNVLVGLSVAELASSYPLAGGPYLWVVELTGNNPKWGVLAFVTGWLNVLGQFANTAGAGFLVAGLVDDIWGLVHDGDDLNAQETLLVYSITLVAAGAVSSMTTKGVRWFTIFAAVFSVSVGLLITILLPIVAKTKQSATFVFATFHGDNHPNTGIDTGSPHDFYTFLLGTLCAHFTFVGLETPAQWAEETKRADRTVPWAIMISIVGTSILGLAYMISILFCIEQPNLVLYGIVDGNISGQVFHDVFKSRFGSGEGGIVLLALVLLAAFNTTVMCMMTNARMLWSFSRDGGVPLYQAWGSVEDKTGTPLCAVWAMTAMAFLIGLPMLHSNEAFDAIGSICASGLYLSCGIPIALRMLRPKHFTPGPFALGRAAPWINSLSLAWIIIANLIFVMPDTYPVTLRNLNYSPVAVGLALILLLAAWFFPVYGVGRWFRGKAHTLKDANLRGGERYLEDHALRERYNSMEGGGHGKLTLARFASVVSRRTQVQPKQRMHLAFSSEVTGLGGDGAAKKGAKRARRKPALPAMPGIPDTEEEGGSEQEPKQEREITGTPQEDVPEEVQRPR
ncbi:hypothetical protein WJX75_003486 [Coccomyxa subellipsoidea]|uniref:Amino acid transporter n=1 Tax=Coccomyxa subellipsoidea TaxID=248742 RepID=A0ABR2YPI5_9CHLO